MPKSQSAQEANEAMLDGECLVLKEVGDELLLVVILPVVKSMPVSSGLANNYANKLMMEAKPWSLSIMYSL